MKPQSLPPVACEVIVNWLSRLWSRDRRRDDRAAAQRIVYPFRGEQQIGACQLVESSKDGARLQRLRGPAIPDEVAFVEVETAQAHIGTVVWRVGEFAGVKIQRSQKLRGFVPPEFSRMKEFWERASAERARERS